MVTRERLPDWEIPLKNPERWREEYGIVALYLNDVAAGALLEIPAGWIGKDAVAHVASGLRHLLQELWHLDLVRPVLAVYTLADGVIDDTRSALSRLSWDDEWHRGDFALRAGRTTEEAAELLDALMGDTMGALDANVRADRAGIPEVRKALGRRREELPASSEAAGSAERRLVDALIAELARANDARAEPNLLSVLRQWAGAEGGDA